MLHYVLGYRCEEADREIILEDFIANDYSEDFSNNILTMLFVHVE